MKTIIAYLSQYLRSLHKPSFFLITLLVAILITLNYTIGIESAFYRESNFLIRTVGFFLLYAFIISTAYLIHFISQKELSPVNSQFYFLLLASSLIFALKMTVNQPIRIISDVFNYPWDDYAYYVMSWPLKCLLVLILISLIWKYYNPQSPVAGMTTKKFNAKPYLILLAMMVPLIGFAATQPDFLVTYPKVKTIAFIYPYVDHSLPWKILYEISYGIDFITIEAFFRGFLVLAFIRFAGAGAILPMAAFYCSIHFGKPLFECITSYFGGIILGVVVYHTRSIWGGLITHVGIAWLMEIGGALGHNLHPPAP